MTQQWWSWTLAAIGVTGLFPAGSKRRRWRKEAAAVSPSVTSSVSQ